MLGKLADESMLRCRHCTLLTYFHNNNSNNKQLQKNAIRSVQQFKIWSRSYLGANHTHWLSYTYLYTKQCSQLGLTLFPNSPNSLYLDQLCCTSSFVVFTVPSWANQAKSIHHMTAYDVITIWPSTCHIAGIDISSIKGRERIDNTNQHVLYH